MGAGRHPIGTVLRSRISLERLIGAIIAVVLIPVAVRIPAIIALGSITALFVGLAAYETVRNEYRHQFRTG